MATLLAVFEPREGFKSSAPAVILPASAPVQATLSYETLHEIVLDFQAQLASLGLEPGKVVSSSLVNGIEFVVSFLAVGAQRLVSAPLNPAYSPGEVSFYLKDTESALLLVPAGTLSAAKEAPTVKAARECRVPLAEVIFNSSAANGRGALEIVFEGGKKAERASVRKPQSQDTALVLHTSGTTGRPKAVPLSHLNLTTTMRNIVNTYNLVPSDRTALVMPLFHVHGLLCGLLATLLSGGSALIPPKFSASVFWKEFIDAKCNWYTAVPTIHQILLASDRPSPIPKLRFIRSCSSALSPATFHAIEEAFGAPVLEAYAMTEAAHQMCSNPLPPAQRKPGSVGLGQGVDVKILDNQGREVAQGQEGEVSIRGANVTKGYINNEKANKESFVSEANDGPRENWGFFRTGDQGKKDADGYIILTGRIKELINRGGEKISPLEIDAALLAIEGVGEAVSFAVPDEKYGEKVGAVIVPKKGATLDPKQIKQALDGKISKFKIPENIYISDSIPKTATGKIQRRNLAATFVKPKL